VLITEIASGPVLNANPAIANGTANWHVQNCTVASVNWPAYQPWPNYQALQLPSLAMTPSGSAVFAQVFSEQEPVSVTTQYNALAFVYSVAGYSGGNVAVEIAWYDSGHIFISQTAGTVVLPLPAGAWTQLSFAQPVFPPQNAAYGAALVFMGATTGNVPASAVLYIGYAGFGPADAYENIPADQIAWTDVSTRNFTQGDIKVSRGI
jgi:hypothetical protein